MKNPRRLIVCVPCALTFQHNYGMYSPAPSPYGNTANLSHTSTTMLVPMHSQAGGVTMTGMPPTHSVILGPGGPQMGRRRRRLLLDEMTFSHIFNPLPLIRMESGRRLLLKLNRNSRCSHFSSLLHFLCRHPCWHPATVRTYGRTTADLPYRLHYRTDLQ